MEHAYDLVVVGGGFCGAGLATVMARAGYHCLVLERDEVFVDRTKGEWIAPWGVGEAVRCGLLDDIRAARGHVIRRHVSFGSGVDPDDAVDDAVPLDMVPGIEGPLTQRHPDVCQALIDAAVAEGAHCLRGVTDIEVTAGIRPTVGFTAAGGAPQRVTARLVVAADGRNSALRRVFGLDLLRSEPHHLFTGLLVDGVDGWPDDLQMIGTEGDLHYLAFPQGDGRARLYLGFGYERRRWLAGPDGPQRFLEAFEFDSLPGHEAFTNAVPASSCAVYPNEATWLPDPTAIDGVVFVGDAAGWDDPITGQGLSISLRDIRVVTELLRASADWDREMLSPYVEERAERMRRLRFASSMTSIIANEFGPEADERRRRFRERAKADRTFGAGRLAAFVGPDGLPSESFSPEAWDRVFSEV